MCQRCRTVAYVSRFGLPRGSSRVQSQIKRLYDCVNKNSLSFSRFCREEVERDSNIVTPPQFHLKKRPHLYTPTHVCFPLLNIIYSIHTTRCTLGDTPHHCTPTDTPPHTHTSRSWISIAIQETPIAILETPHCALGDTPAWKQEENRVSRD